MSLLVYVPTTRAAAGRLREGHDSDTVTGYAATPELFRSAGLGLEERENAEYAALSYAGVDALVTSDDPLRLVIAAEVADSQVVVAGGPDGAVTVHHLTWSSVHALYADDPEQAAAVASARQEAVGRSVEQALDVSAVVALLTDADLLWYDPGELDDLPERGKTPGHGGKGAD